MPHAGLQCGVTSFCPKRQLPCSLSAGYSSISEVYGALTSPFVSNSPRYTVLPLTFRWKTVCNAVNVIIIIPPTSQLLLRLDGWMDRRRVTYNVQSQEILSASLSTTFAVVRAVNDATFFRKLLGNGKTLFHCWVNYSLPTIFDAGLIKGFRLSGAFDAKCRHWNQYSRHELNT